jgi:hypothetical protein
VPLFALKELPVLKVPPAFMVPAVRVKFDATVIAPAGSIVLPLLLISTFTYSQSSQNCRYDSHDFNLVDINKSFLFIKENKVFEVDGFHKTEKVYSVRQLNGHHHPGLRTKLVEIPRNGCLDEIVATSDEGTLVEMKTYAHPAGKLHAGSSSIIVNSQKDKLIYLGKSEDQKLVFSRMGVTRGGSLDHHKEILPKLIVMIPESDLADTTILREFDTANSSPKELIAHNFCHMGFFTEIIKNENKVKYYDSDHLKSCESSKRNALCLKGAKREYDREIGFDTYLRFGVVTVAYADQKILGIKPRDDFQAKKPQFCTEISYCKNNTNIGLEIEYFDRVHKVFCQ